MAPAELHCRMQHALLRCILSLGLHHSGGGGEPFYLVQVDETGANAGDFRRDPLLLHYILGQKSALLH
jgi:hypothetical protein